MYGKTLHSISFYMTRGIFFLSACVVRGKKPKMQLRTLMGVHANSIDLVDLLQIHVGHISI